MNTQTRIRRKQYQNDPLKFFKDQWPDIILWDKLENICKAVVENRRIVIPSGHGIGKTWLLARIVLWFLSCFYPSKVITTAPTWNQVERQLWTEIAKAYNTMQFPLTAELLQTRLKIEEDWFAVGFSTTGHKAERDFGAVKFQGYHSPNLLVALDEGPGVDHSIWVSAETLITGENNKIIAIGNPTSPSGDFYDACKSPLWKKVEISSFDHPNVKQNKIVIPGAVTREWIDERRMEWGEGSPLWDAKILGKFPAEGTDTLIPLAKAEACIGLGLSREGEKRLGVDVARYGDDSTSLCDIHGQVVLPLEVVNKKDTSWTAGRIKIKHKTHKYDAIAVDDTGVGGGVTDALEDDEIDVDAINFGSQAVDNNMFENRVSEMYWFAREKILAQEIELPNDSELINQLCSRKYKYTRRGKYQIESKDDLKKRGLKSPDKADSFVLALNAGITENAPEITIITTGDDE